MVEVVRCPNCGLVRGVDSGMPGEPEAVVVMQQPLNGVLIAVSVLSVVSSVLAIWSFIEDHKEHHHGG